MTIELFEAICMIITVVVATTIVTATVDSIARFVAFKLNIPYYKN